MNDGTRWAVIIVCVVLVIGLVGWARGPEHHRGARTGSRASAPATVVVIAP